MSHVAYCSIGLLCVVLVRHLFSEHVGSLAYLLKTRRFSACQFPFCTGFVDRRAWSISRQDTIDRDGGCQRQVTKALQVEMLFRVERLRRPMMHANPELELYGQKQSTRITVGRVKDSKILDLCSVDERGRTYCSISLIAASRCSASQAHSDARHPSHFR